MTHPTKERAALHPGQVGWLWQEVCELRRLLRAGVELVGRMEAATLLAYAEDEGRRDLHEQARVWREKAGIVLQ